MVAAFTEIPWRRYAGIALFFAALYAVAYIFGAQFRNSTGISPFWPASGILLAWFIVGGVAQLPIAFLTLLTMQILVPTGLGLPEQLVKAILITAGYSFIALLARRLIPFDRWWTRLREPLIFWVLTLLGCVLIGLVTTVDLTPSEGASPFNLRKGLDFGIGDFIGCLMLTPLVALSFLGDETAKRPFGRAIAAPFSWHRLLEFSGQAILVVLCVYIAFSGRFDLYTDPEHLLFLPMLWIAFRSGTKGAAWGGLGIAAATSVVILLGDFGPQRMGSLQVFYVSLLASGYALGVTISGRERVIEELASSEERYKLASQAVQDGVWEYDFETRQLLVSEPFKRIVGDLSIPSVLPASWWVDRIHPDDVDWVLRAVEEHLVKDTPYRVQHRLRHPSGDYIWVFAFGQVVRNAKGGAVKMCGAVNDITERRRAELEVQALNAELEIRVAERTAKLQQANDELASFSYSVSHDLRGPLRAINGFAKLLEDECGDDIRGDGRMYLERIRLASVRMGTLIDDLLQLSRMARVEPRRNEVNVTVLVESILEDLRVNQPERRVDVLVEPDMLAIADPSLLRNLLQNLLQNAWKFTVKTPDSFIEVGRQWQDEEWIYYIRDNGIGFDPQFSAKLFLPFERLHSDPAFPGTGIGLATVAKAVDLHGGRIWAEGLQDMGATFYFTLGQTSVPRHEASTV